MRTPKEELKGKLEAIKTFGPTDWELSFMDTLYGMDKVNDKEADIFLIENAAEFDSFGMFVGADEDKSWHFHYGAIADGDYPLEKLPPHIKDIAERMYYKKAAL